MTLTTVTGWREKETMRKTTLYDSITLAAMGTATIQKDSELCVENVSSVFKVLKVNGLLIIQKNGPLEAKV